jgi:hypothetical protein
MSKSIGNIDSGDQQKRDEFNGWPKRLFCVEQRRFLGLLKAADSVAATMRQAIVQVASVVFVSAGIGLAVSPFNSDVARKTNEVHPGGWLLRIA